MWLVVKLRRLIACLAGVLGEPETREGRVKESSRLVVGRILQAKY